MKKLRILEVTVRDLVSTEEIKFYGNSNDIGKRVKDHFHSKELSKLVNTCMSKSLRYDRDGYKVKRSKLSIENEYEVSTELLASVRLVSSAINFNKRGEDVNTKREKSLQVSRKFETYNKLLNKLSKVTKELSTNYYLLDEIKETIILNIRVYSSSIRIPLENHLLCMVDAYLARIDYEVKSESSCTYNVKIKGIEYRDKYINFSNLSKNKYDISRDDLISLDRAINVIEFYLEKLKIEYEASEDSCYD